jgi:hypothetical protein
MLKNLRNTRGFEVKEDQQKKSKHICLETRNIHSCEPITILHNNIKFEPYKSNMSISTTTELNYSSILTYSMEHSHLEKLTSLQLVKKFPAIYGTQRFITSFTSDHHLSPEPAQSSPYPHIPLPEDPS